NPATRGCGVHGTVCQSDLLDLAELELHRSGAPENKNRDLDPALLVVDLFDHAVEIRERTVDDTNGLARLEQRLGLGFVTAVRNTAQNGFRLAICDRGGLVRGATDETHHTRRILDQVPGRLVHLHLDQHVARKELALALALLAIAHFHHFFGGHEDLAEQVFHAGQLDALDQRAHDMLFVTRISMHNIPTLSHVAPLTDDQRNKPAEQGVETPQQERHDKNDRNHDEGGLGGLLPSRPDHLADFRTGFLGQNEECTTLGRARRDKASHARQHQQYQDPVQQRLGSKHLITDDTDSH